MWEVRPEIAAGDKCSNDLKKLKKNTDIHMSVGQFDYNLAQMILCDTVEED